MYNIVVCSWTEKKYYFSGYLEWGEGCFNDLQLSVDGYLQHDIIMVCMAMMTVYVIKK